MYKIFLTGITGFVGTSVLNYFGSENTLQHKRGDSFKIDSVSVVIHLAGKAHDFKNASNADEYKIERAVDIQGIDMWYSTIATTTELSYNDTAMASGQKYWYRVRAVNTNGEGVTSSATSVTTNTQTAKIQTGYFVGNGGDLSITGLGFAPDLLFIKSTTTATAAVFRAKIMRDAPNNQISFFINSADNSAAQLNVQNVVYYYIAFAGSDCSASGSFCVGMYS